MPSSIRALSGTSEKSGARLLPRPAPTASDGEKIPPGMPLIAAKVVARSLSPPKLAGSGVPDSSAVFTCV